jgi:hypothetical protein
MTIEYHENRIKLTAFAFFFASSSQLGHLGFFADSKHK